MHASVAGIGGSVLTTPSVVLAVGRVALVVGNSASAHIGRLPNPDNDAGDMSGTCPGHVPGSAAARL